MSTVGRCIDRRTAVKVGLSLCGTALFVGASGSLAGCAGESSDASEDSPALKDDTAEDSTASAGSIPLVRIGGGRFTIGSPSDERQRQEDEAQHEVVLSDFELCPYEVSQAEYEDVMGANPSHFQGADLPVDSVSWYDAINFCNLLSEREGLARAYEVDEAAGTVAWNREADGYRLPTEAEWEVACRAGTSTPFVPGGQIVSADANFEGSYPYLIEENYVVRRDDSVRTSENRGRTIGVSELEPNGYGIFNMAGNVSEWCFDWHGEYGEGADNPAGPQTGTLRVNRGGGYDDFAKQLRSAYRSATNPRCGDWNMGFRIARGAIEGAGRLETSLAYEHAPEENGRVLVACFSYSGNTWKAARIVADALGADLFRIEMAEPYAGNIYEASQADLNSDARPSLASRVDNMADYDTVLLGYPTWWSTAPMAVFSFLEEHDLSGKFIVTFSSNGGTRFGDSVSDVAKAAAGATVGQGFEFYYGGGGSLEGDLQSWLERIGMMG